MKEAKIIPVFKTGDKLLMSNYRPISILSSFSKIFEKCIYKRLFSFFDKHKVLSPNQYSFRPGFNTTHAITDIVTTAYENMGNNHYTGLIFLDLKKAFDTLNHNILISKLNHYGIRGVAHSLLSSYLTNRKQSVTNNNYCSTPLKINNGVPQGSTLGPLLFLIYLNDLENNILTSPRLFADDTCICVNADTISNLEYLINSELLRVNNWLKANKLILNALKSKALIILPKTRQQAPNLEITIDSCQISVVESVKYLGIYLDNKLTFGPYIAYLQSKLSRSIGIISKIKYYVPDRAILLLHLASFHSHITYGLIIWYSTYKTYSSKISKLQNRIIKIITKSNPREKVLSLFKKHGILTLDDLFTYEMAALMFKYLSNNVPYNLSQYFTLTSDIHTLTTRSCSSDTYYLPRFKTNKLQHSIKFIGVKVWNKIPNAIKNCSLNVFLKKLKTSILDTC